MKYHWVNYDDFNTFTLLSFSIARQMSGHIKMCGHEVVVHIHYIENGKSLNIYDEQQFFRALRVTRSTSYPVTGLAPGVTSYRFLQF